MKKFISIVLTLVLLCSSVSYLGGVAYAQDNPIFRIASVEADPGESVDVTVSLENNPGITSIKLLLTYDQALTLTGIDYNSAMGGQTIQPQTMTSPVILIWVSPFANCTMNGTFATLHFDLSETAEAGNSYAISATYDPDDVYNLAEDNIAFDVINGAVSLTPEVDSCQHTHKTLTAAKESTCQEQGWDAYYTCDDCGQIFLSDGTTEVAECPFRPVGEHRGGTATCQNRAMCSVCGQYYGDCGNHDYSAQTKIQAALKMEGNCKRAAIYYYSCAVCGACEKNPAHTFAGEYGEHTYAITVTPATPEAQGYTTHTCTVCGYSFSDNYVDYNNIVASGFCGAEGDGKNLTWILDADGLLTISGNGAMRNENTSWTSPWYNYRTQIKEVKIEDGVTSIGSLMFANCISVKKMTISNSVTSIGGAAFLNCENLADVYLSNHLVSIGEEAFKHCDRLKSIIIPSSVTSIGNEVFFGCNGLTSITVDAANTVYSSDSYGVLFYKNTTLICCPGGYQGEYIVPDDVKVISRSAFVGCSKLTHVIFPGSLKSIGHDAFRGCSKLKDVVIPDSVTSISTEAFWECNSLNSISFNGNAPTMGTSVFRDITVTAYYPAGNDTWTDEVKQNYGGNITWIERNACEHQWDGGNVIREPSCTELGETLFTCTVCQQTRVESIPMIAHVYSDTWSWNADTHWHECVCGDKYGVEEHSYQETLTPATPATQGYTTYTCTACGYSYKGNYVDYDEPDSNAPILTVSSAKACAGKTVTVTVDLDNNPGLNTFTLGFVYNTDVLMLTDVVLNDGLSGNFAYSSKAVFLASADTTYNGEILTLTFSVAEDAEDGEYPVTVSYRPGDICNLAEEDINPVIISGAISVYSHIPGDINGDGIVNNKDLNRLMKYLSGEEIEVVEEALNVNGDDTVNNKDLNRLMKYLSGEVVEIY